MRKTEYLVKYAFDKGAEYRPGYMGECKVFAFNFAEAEYKAQCFASDISGNEIDEVVIKAMEIYYA